MKNFGNKIRLLEIIITQRWIFWNSILTKFFHDLRKLMRRFWIQEISWERFWSFSILFLFLCLGWFCFIWWATVPNWNFQYNSACYSGTSGSQTIAPESGVNCWPSTIRKPDLFETVKVSENSKPVEWIPENPSLYLSWNQLYHIAADLRNESMKEGSYSLDDYYKK